MSTQNQVGGFLVSLIGLHIDCSIGDLLPDSHAYENMRQIYDRSDDAGCFRLISEWLHKCESDHPYCVQSGHGSGPGRLLEIGEEDNQATV